MIKFIFTCTIFQSRPCASRAQKKGKKEKKAEPINAEKNGRGKETVPPRNGTVLVIGYKEKS